MTSSNSFPNSLPNAFFGQPSGPTTINPENNTNMVQRPEMRGPQNSDIDNILSGLKPKTVTLSSPAPAAQPMSAMEDDSMISISSLKDLQNTNMPRRSGGRRKNRSDKNTVSLDL
jgi:hypothetical protein